MGQRADPDCLKMEETGETSLAPVGNHLYFWWDYLLDGRDRIISIHAADCKYGGAWYK